MRLSPKTPPPLDPSQITVGVFRFDHDMNEHLQSDIIRELHDVFHDMQSIRVLFIDHTIDVRETEDQQRAADKEYAKASGAALVIWRDLITTRDGSELVHPYWMMTTNLAAERPKPLVLNNQLASLDPSIEIDVTDLLGLVVATFATSTLNAREGIDVAAKLPGLIERERALIPFKPIQRKCALYGGAKLLQYPAR